MESKVMQTKDILKKYKQEHIIRLIEKQAKSKQEEISDKILSIDFDELESLYKEAKKTLDIDTSQIEPITALKPDKLPPEIVNSYISAGRDIVIGNKYSVVTMAGGQGTRLRIQ